MKPVSPLDCAVLPGPYHCSATASLAGCDCPPMAIASVWVLNLTNTSAANVGDASSRSSSDARMRVHESLSNGVRITQSG